MYNALTDDTTLAVLKYGYSTFIAGTGQTEVALNKGTIPKVEPLYNNKIVAGNFIEMTAGEKTIADAAETAKEEKQATGAIKVGRTVATTAQLPKPPPADALLVALLDAGGGKPGLALSTGAGWAIFISDSVIT